MVYRQYVSAPTCDARLSFSLSSPSFTTSPCQIDSRITAQLFFAIAKAYADMKRFDESFAHYKIGNDFWKAGIWEYDEGQDRLRVNVLSSAFEPLRAYVMDEEPDEDEILGEDAPIFIVGMPRSGSTMVEQILGAHSTVYAAGEDTAFAPLMREVIPVVASSPPGVSATRFASFGRQYVDTMMKRTNKTTTTRFTDKHLYNYWYIGFIRLLLPRAKIVYVVRDPRATCVSMYRQLFVQSRVPTILESYSLSACARAYNAHADMMAYWTRTVSPHSLMTLSYEEMVLDFDNAVRKLADFAGLELEASMLSFWKSTRVVQTASIGQVNTPVYTSAVDKWRVYERHLSPLMSTLKSELVAAADERIRRLRHKAGLEL